MRLVYHYHYLPVSVVHHIVLTVFDYLIVKPLQHEQHLRIRYGPVLICKQGLEIKHHEVFIGGDGRFTVP